MCLMRDSASKGGRGWLLWVQAWRERDWNVRRRRRGRRGRKEWISAVRQAWGVLGDAGFGKGSGTGGKAYLISIVKAPA